MAAATMLTAVSCVRSGAAENTAPGNSSRSSGTEQSSDTAGASGLHADSLVKDSGKNTVFGIPVDSYNVTTGKVKRNQFISSILAAQGVDWNDIESCLMTIKIHSIRGRYGPAVHIPFLPPGTLPQGRNTLFISMIRGLLMFSP